MKKLSLLILVLALATGVSAEKGFDGSIYEAYKPVYNEAFLTGWEVINYIEPSGLLLSATGDEAEITVTLQEESAAPAAYLAAYVAGITRYGKDIEEGSIINLSLSGFEQAARVNYSYRSLRDSGEGEIYRAEMVAAKLKTGYMLLLSMVTWGDGETDRHFLEGFVNGFRLEQVMISTTYTALLKYCEKKDDGIYLTLDFCEMEYEPVLGMSYAVNADATEYTCKLRYDAEVWLPEFGSALYSLKRAGADDIEISIAIESYYNINEAYAAYLVLFDQSGDVIRLQHYNAL